MSFRSTWWLMSAALALGAFIFFVERRANRSETVASLPPALLDFNPSQITAVEITRTNQIIHADRVANRWQLASPTYPALASSVDGLLEALGNSRKTTTISARDIATQPGGGAAFGVSPPRAAITIIASNGRQTLNLGNKTLVGEQIYAQIVGNPDLFITDGKILASLPSTFADWRDPALLSPDNPVFDRLIVTNMGRISVDVQLDAASLAWRLVRPMDARADALRVQFLIQKLGGSRVSKWVTDDARADLDAFGLQSPELQLTLARGSNEVFQIQFGRSPTNEPALIYARRPAQPSIFLVQRQGLAELLSQPHTFYRDDTLVSLAGVTNIDRVDIRAEERFSLIRAADGAWQIASPAPIRADPELVQRMFDDVQHVKVTDFEADVVADLAPFGLEASARQYSFRTSVTNAVGATNQLVAQLDFSKAITNRLDRVFARRSDEKSVYSVALGEVQRLPKAGYQLRDRQLFDFDARQLTSVTITQRGKTRKLTLDPVHGWSPDEVLSAAITETIHRLSRAKAINWVTRGEDQLRYFSLDHRLTVEVQTPGQAVRTFSIQFGKFSPSGHIYGGSTLDGGALVVFEFPQEIYSGIAKYLSIPDPPASNP
ncbi:MAG: DUF4340 domain-containing protein [Pedosphaera sp.]|nr:DUF4340 domain-containing protein [Pedosphaera sp.]